MKTKLVILVLIFVLFSFVQGQENCDSLKIFKKHSLQFGVRTLSLTNFSGALISYKYHFNDESAIRFGVNARIEKSKNESIRDYSFYDTSYIEQDLENIFSSIQINIQYLKYINAESEIKVFYGIGPQIEIDMYDFDTDKIYTYGNYNQYDKKRIDDRFRFGLRGSIGTEWFFQNNLSLHAEYGFFAYYFIEKEQRITIREYTNEPLRYNESKRDISGWGFSNTSALFGLSVYF